MSKTKIINAVLFILVICLSILPCEGGVTNLTPNEINKLVNDSVEKYTNLKKIAVDPIVIDEIVQSITEFDTNFCGTYQTPECSKNFDDRGVFFNILSDYLNEIVKDLHPEIRSIGARLAEGTFTRIGKSEMISSSASLIKIPNRFKNSKIFKKSATKLYYLGENINVAILAPGNNSIVIKSDGKSDEFKFLLKPNIRQNLIQGGLSNSDSTEALIPREGAFCYKQYPDKLEGPLAFFDWGRHKSTNDQNQHLADYARLSNVNIKISIDNKINCDEKCKYNLGALFAEAISVWRSGCGRCNQNALVFIKTDAGSWLDSRIVSRINHKSKNLDLNKELSTDPQYKISPGRFYIGKKIVYYEGISKQTLEAICNLSDSDAPWVDSVQSLSCNPVTNEDRNEIKASIHLINGDTNCGSLAIGCGLPDNKIQINLGRYYYQFMTNNDEVISLGTPNDVIVNSYDLWTVIFHEVGHWFGVPHPDEIIKDGLENDIMKSEYLLNADTECVTGQTLILLNNASDLRWKYRLKSDQGGGALMPPKASR